jgi:hypothetical protein
MRRTNLTTAISALAAAGVTALVLAAGASAADFTTPVQLSFPPSGGEPSIATDPQGDAFVVGPQRIPSGASGHGGTGYWRSTNDGASFAPGTFIGSYLGGGDDDIVYSGGALYTADLEAAATEVCKSTDRGLTWGGIGPVPDPTQCSTINSGQTAPSDDRPWLAADPSDPQRLYVVYHEFVSAQPLGFRTDNGGADNFVNPCGSIVTDPSIEANVPTDITGGTLVARPVVDKSGNLYILFATTTQQENAQAASQGQPSGTFSQLYLAVSQNHCQTFTDHTVFDGQSKYGMNTVQFGDIFNDLVIDGAGNLYTVAAGAIGTKPFPSGANIYVLKSTNHGQTWSSPTELSTQNGTQMLPAAVAGPGAGQLEIGYFRTINGVTNPNDTSAKWTYATAQSTNAAGTSATYTYRDVNPGFVYHNGDICNLGILCGQVPGGPSDRSLLDFTSAALDTNNCPLFTFAGNPTGSPGNNSYPPTPTYNYVTRQLSGCFATASSTSNSTSSSSASGRAGSNKRSKHKKKKHKNRKKHHRRAKKISRPPRVSAGFTG